MAQTGSKCFVMVTSCVPVLEKKMAHIRTKSFKRSIKFMQPLHACLLLAAGMAPPLTAAHAQGSSDSAWRYSIGLGIYGSQSPFQKDKHGNDSGALPWFSIESYWVSIDPSALEIGLVRQDHWQVDLLVAPRWLIADPADNPQHSDINRDVGVDAGVKIETSFDRYTGTLELKSDVSETNNGNVAALDLAAGFNLTPKLSAGIKAGVAWRDRDSSTYEYGVLPNEVRIDRPAFALNATLTPFAGLQVTYAVNPSVSAVFAAQADFLPDAVGDSPIVERDRLLVSFASLNYTF